MMKIIFVQILSVFVVFQLQAQISDVNINGCNLDTPSFGADLGVVTRGSNVEFAGKIWSGPVTAENCRKEKFEGGKKKTRKTYPNFNADCRFNPGYSGSLFSWCAVIRFADTLCPYPWRVPTGQDFEELMISVCDYHKDYEKAHVARNGNTVVRCYQAFMSVWTQGHDYYCDALGNLTNQFTDRPSMLNDPNRPQDWYYWAQSEQDTNTAWTFGTWDVVSIGSKLIEKNMGVTLRCVKDI